MAYTSEVFKVARSCPTFHPVTRADSFFGFGIVPSFALRQTVITEQSKRPATVPTLTNAASGNESKLANDCGDEVFLLCDIYVTL